VPTTCHSWVFRIIQDHQWTDIKCKLEGLDSKSTIGWARECMSASKHYTSYKNSSIYRNRGSR
jgi:hypothetical protein